MRNMAVSNRPRNRNGIAPDAKAAVRIVERAFALKRKHKSPLDGLTDAQIMAKIKKTRYTLFEDRFGSRS